MNITLKEIKKEDKDILNNLMQLYLHNISLSFPMDFDSKTGLYAYDDLESYIDSDINKALLILNENEIVGFMFVDLLEDKNIIQEMFILNNYKRKGIGGRAVSKVFDSFKGNWEIKSLPCSKNAEKFWIYVIKNYTNDNFNLEYIGKFNRAVLTFNNEQ